MKISEATYDDLVKELSSLHCSIFKMDCYSTWDLGRYEAIASELERRGYNVDEDSYPVVTKREEDGDE